MSACISCGAPRQGRAFPATCQYCGRLHSVSLAHEFSLFDENVKSELRSVLDVQGAAASIEKTYSIVLLYLLDGLADLAEYHVSKLLQTNPETPQVFILKALLLLNKKGVKKSKISDVEAAISSLNLGIALGGDSVRDEVAQLASIIFHGYYKHNSISVNPKLSGLISKIGEMETPSGTLAALVTRFH